METNLCIVRCKTLWFYIHNIKGLRLTLIITGDFKLFQILLDTNISRYNYKIWQIQCEYKNCNIQDNLAVA